MKVRFRFFKKSWTDFGVFRDFGLGKEDSFRFEMRMFEVVMSPWIMLARCGREGGG